MTPARVLAVIFLLLAPYCAIDPFKHSAISDFLDFEAYRVELPDWSLLPTDRDAENLLQKSEIKFLNQVQGPESVVFDPLGRGPYTGFADGRILFWDGKSWTDFAYTSPNRPLGLRFHKKTGDLYIADAYFGLLKVGPEGGLASSLTTEAEGAPLRFTNDLDIDEEGNVYFTNSSTKYQRRKFCANLKHSERLNSGVMVVEPSQTVFNDMMSKVKTLSSYTRGDQGFLNSYYSGFSNAHVFEPNLPLEKLKSKPAPEMERLFTLYNADVGLYMLANKWMVDERELRVTHCTLGPLKPWDWWTSWLLKPVDVWQNVRVQLQETLPGTGGGENPNDELLIKFLFMLPFCALIICYYRSFFQTWLNVGSLCEHIRHLHYKIRSTPTLAYNVVSPPSTSNLNQQPKVPVYLGGVSVFICFTAAVVALGPGLSIVPRQVMPWTDDSINSGD